MFDSKTEPQNQIRIPHSEIRILLWDIDGTLMHSNRSGAYKDYFIPTLEKIYGTAGRLAEMTVSGMTDTQIAYESLKDEGFEVADIFTKLDEFIEVLGKEMRRVIAQFENPYGVFDGVREILAETKNNPIFVNSLLTGNLSTVAEAKLQNVKLWHYFENQPKAFGEISHQRADLAKFVGKEFNHFFQTELNPEQFIIIGDTPNDIACARAFGAKAVAIGTGRNHSTEELAKHNPDILLENLTNTQEVIKIFTQL